MSATGLTRRELEALPVGAVVLDKSTTAWQTPERGWWNSTDDEELDTDSLHRDCRPLALLFDPSVGYVRPDGAQIALPLRKVGAK